MHSDIYREIEMFVFFNVGLTPTPVTCESVSRQKNLCVGLPLLVPSVPNTKRRQDVSIKYDFLSLVIEILD